MSAIGIGAIRIGASAFTAPGWKGAFYPPELKSSDYLGYYAERFDTVEVDSTFYGTPRLETVRHWYEATPAGFVFSVKAPQLVTHERCLRDCQEEFTAFLNVMDGLKEKMGTVLLQFPYFTKKQFSKNTDFLERLKPFLEQLPKSGRRFAVEVRNKAWLKPELASLLREHGTALALIDHPYMPRPAEYFEAALTADFTYIRLLGDRYAIEEQTKVWDKVIVDRTHELRDWTNIGESIHRRGIDVMVYVNNHYAGHAPATIRLLREMWAEKNPQVAAPAIAPKDKSKAKGLAETPSLFEDD